MAITNPEFSIFLNSPSHYMKNTLKSMPIKQLLRFPSCYSAGNYVKLKVWMQNQPPSSIKK